jgi:hypothetical protein
MSCASTDENMISYKEFNVANIGTTSLYNGRSSGLYYGNQPFVMFDTALMTSPFAVSQYTNRDKKTYSLTLSFDGYQSDESLQIMKCMVESLDDMMIELAIKHSVLWFKKPLSRENIVKMYKPILKPSNNPAKYAPSIRVKLKQMNDQITTRVLFVNKSGIDTPFDIMDLTPGAQVKCVIKLSNVWVMNDTFGVSLETEEAYVHEHKVKKPASISFIQDEF